MPASRVPYTHTHTHTHPFTHTAVMSSVTFFRCGPHGLSLCTFAAKSLLRTETRHLIFQSIIHTISPRCQNIGRAGHLTTPAIQHASLCFAPVDTTDDERSGRCEAELPRKLSMRPHCSRCHGNLTRQVRAISALARCASFMKGAGLIDQVVCASKML